MAHINWENFRRDDGTLDLVAALHDYRRVNTRANEYQKAVDYLLECEDLCPLRTHDAATIAVVFALRLAYED